MTAWQYWLGIAKPKSIFTKPINLDAMKPYLINGISNN